MASDGRAAPDARDIEEITLAFLRRELLQPGTVIDRDADLLSGEVLDSIGVLRLASFVGEQFQIEIRPSDFVVENFRSIAAIAGYVLRSVAASRAQGTVR
jgi:acyl carrier protein